MQEPPRTATERAVAGLWWEMTGNPQIARHQTFYDVGGGSLNLLEVLSELSWQFGVDLNAPALLEHPTVVGIAQHIDRQLAVRNEIAWPASPNRYPPHAPLPLSFEQLRLQHLEQAFGHVEPVLVAFNFVGPLQVAALTSALQHIVRRHEVLRTQIGGGAEGPCQVVAAPPFELERWAAPEQSAVGLDWLRALGEKLSREMLNQRSSWFRAVLVQVHGEEHYLLVGGHRMACDAASLCTVLPREISMLYTARVRDEPLPFRELLCQYGQYASWQRDWLQTRTGQEEMSVWQAAFRERRSPLINRQPRDAAHASRHAERWPRSFADRIARQAANQSASTLAVLAAACGIVVSRLLDRTRLQVESINPRRSLRELEPLMGCFASSVLFEIDVPSDGSFLEVLRGVNASLVETFSQQFVPIDSIAFGREAGRSTAFSVALHRDSAVRFDMPQIKGSCTLPPRLSSTHAIAFDFYETEQALECECNCLMGDDAIDPQHIILEVASVLQAITDATGDVRVTQLREPARGCNVKLQPAANHENSLAAR